MDDWKINNYSNRKFLIQKNEKEISIVEPLNNGSFKILAEIHLSDADNGINIYDDNLYVSIRQNNEEITIYDSDSI